MERLFVGVKLSNSAASALGSLILSAPSVLPAVSWQPVDNFHVTLRFIGEVPVDRRDTITEALRAVACTSFAANVIGIDCFPAKGPVRVIHGAVSNDPSISFQELQSSVDDALLSCGLNFSREKAFIPHVTFGRNKRESNTAINEWASGIVFEPVSFAVSEFQLLRSVLTKTGAVYEVVETYPLCRSENLEDTAMTVEP